jgi:hypothetical protein
MDTATPRMTLVSILALITALLVGVTGAWLTTESGSPASAHEDPAGCSPQSTLVFPDITVNAPPEGVTEGAILNFDLSAQVYPHIPHQPPSCTPSNIELFIDLPPKDGSYDLVCGFPGDYPPLASLSCPSSVPYTVEAADADQNDDLVVTYAVLADLHDSPGDCIDPAPRTPSAAQCYSSSFEEYIPFPDTDVDGYADGEDNCPGDANPGQVNTDREWRENGQQLSGFDETWPMHDESGDACDADDDNDGLSDADEASGAMCGGTATNPNDHDTDGDHLHDGWECSEPMGMPAPNAATMASIKYIGTGTADGDGDLVPDNWERRGYNGSAVNTDGDADGCHDLVETASVDDNRAIGDPDRLAVARMALGIWTPMGLDDVYALDIDKNGMVGDNDRLFVARAALLPAWQPKNCP